MQATLKAFQVKAVGLAVIIRCDRQEGSIAQVLETSYSNLEQHNCTLITDFVQQQRPDLQ